MYTEIICYAKSIESVSDIFDVHQKFFKLWPYMQRLFTFESPSIGILMPNFQPLLLGKLYINDSGRVICCRLCLYLSRKHYSIAITSAVFWSIRNKKDEMSVESSFGEKGGAVIP